MPLVAYMKSSDPGRISTLTTLDGDKSRRKKIEAIKTSPEKMYVTIFTYDCLSHTPGGSVVPVMLKRFKAGMGWEEIGIAKCCPLCWRILVAPVGMDLPEARPIVFEANQIQAAKSEDRERRKQNYRTDTERVQVALKKIEKLAAAKGRISVQDVMPVVGLGRVSCLRYLGWLVKWKRLEKVESGGGRGNRTFYKKAP